MIDRGRNFPEEAVFLEDLPGVLKRLSCQEQWDLRQWHRAISNHVRKNEDEDCGGVGPSGKPTSFYPGDVLPEGVDLFDIRSAVKEELGHLLLLLERNAFHWNGRRAEPPPETRKTMNLQALNLAGAFGFFPLPSGPDHRNRMTGFDDFSKGQGKAVAILCRHQPFRDAVAQNFLNRFRHGGRRLSRADDENPFECIETEGLFRIVRQFYQELILFDPKDLS